MKKQSFETWLFKEAMRLANTNKRSVKEIIKSEYRARLYIAILNFETNKLVNLNTESALAVNEMAFKLKNNDIELTNEFNKAKNLYKNSLISKKNTKKAIIKLLKKKNIDSSTIKKNNIQTSNYSSFINGNLNALSLHKAKALLRS